MSSGFIADEDVSNDKEIKDEEAGDVDSDDEEVADDSEDRATDKAIREATERKEQGTAQFKAGNFADAVPLYLEVFGILTVAPS